MPKGQTIFFGKQVRKQPYGMATLGIILRFSDLKGENRLFDESSQN